MAIRQAACQGQVTPLLRWYACMKMKRDSYKLDIARLGSSANTLERGVGMQSDKRMCRS